MFQAVSEEVTLYRYFLMSIPSTRCHTRHEDIFEYSVCRKTEGLMDWCAHSLCFYVSFSYIFFCPMPPHVLVDFVVLPPEHGSSVTDFWGWDAHEVQLRCPDDVSGDIGG